MTAAARPAVAASPAEHLLTFSGPVQVPGVSLAAGDYIFRFLTPSVVQVLPSDRSAVYAMFTGIPVSRTAPTSGYQVTLAMNRYDAPLRVAKLFTPGSSSGLAFIYPPLRPMHDFVVPLPGDVTRLETGGGEEVRR